MHKQSSLAHASFVFLGSSVIQTKYLKMNFWDKFDNLQFYIYIIFVFLCVSLQLERARYMQDNDDRLDQQAVRYEERITELHSVIAELNKKIDRSHSNAIQ